MKLFYKLMHVCLVMFATVSLYAQGVTTGNFSGSVTDSEGVEAIGATVVVTHEPSGTTYGTATRVDGSFYIPNVRVGGPYSVKISYVGYKDQTLTNKYVGLGQDTEIKVTLTQGVDIDVIEVSAANYLDNYKMGSESQVTERDLANLPTASRDINDYLRLNPLANVSPADPGSSISIAGMNNRYNSIFIDGAVNNDVFGLAPSGTNGGQTGISPISLDAIEQFQISVSPYDVKLGGFAGAGINAVTRSGTNKFEGSAYYFFRNQGLTGKTPTFNLPDSVERLRVDDYTAQTFGFRLGGPIVKNKVFFFVNAEIQRDRTPRGFDLSSYGGSASVSDLQALINKLKSYGYDPGDYLSTADELKGERILAKVDWNINQNNKLSLRHSYTRARSIDPFTSGSQSLYFSNTAIYFPSTTNSTALEWNSIINNKFSNNLIAGFTSINDDRDPQGGDFPWIRINDGTSSIYVGSEEFSTGNQLKQNIFTLTDNFNIYLNKHTLTVGTHNEFYNMYNLFIRQNYGSYRFNSIADFLGNDTIAPIDYVRSYSLVDDLTGDGSAAAAKFNAMQLGLYVQDEFKVSKRFTLTGGLRFDLPMFLTQPAVDTFFNNNVLAVVDSVWGAEGAEAGQMPGAQIYISPRVGFNYDIMGDRKSIVRGGVGLFTSRVPFVWPAGSYTNNGLTVGGIDPTNPPLFNPDPYDQYVASDVGATIAIPSGEMNLVSKDFRFPQVLRTSLAVDQKLPGDMTLTVEGMFSKTLNNIYYKNVNLRPATDSLDGTPDNRPLYSGQRLSNVYSAIYLMSNTNEGYTYNVTAQLTKNLWKGFSGMVAYTFGRAYSIYEGTSSQNSSQWRGQHGVDGRNFATLGRSEFDMGSRITSALSYEISYPANSNVFGKTTVSLFYNGQSGRTYSYIINDAVRIGNTTYRALNGEDNRERTLMYVPADQSEINLIDKPGRTATEQWEELNAFIENDPYLSTRRGQYAERNMSRSPFTNLLDFRVLQDFTVRTANGQKNTIQISFDVMNITNLLNQDWGRVFRVSNFGNYELLNFEGFDPTATGGAKVPLYSFPEQTVKPWFTDDFLSRWRMQLGVRYIFN
jgi:hypothetical protein